MKQRNWGRIVFISSESAIQIPAEIHYGMTKTAQHAIARELAEITAGTNVTVNSVLPGPTASSNAVNSVREGVTRLASRPEAQLVGGAGVLRLSSSRCQKGIKIS